MSLPGSDGEHQLQEQFGNSRRAEKFYNKQVVEYLTPEMINFLSQQNMAFISTSDIKGECDCSFRAGPPGFIQILNNKLIAYPEYIGNGVVASMGNISENPHIGLLLIDFIESAVGLHINGKAAIIENSEMLNFIRNSEIVQGSHHTPHQTRPSRWIMIEVEEAYVHCSKHIPKFSITKDTDHARPTGDIFSTKNSKRSWLESIS